MPAPLVHPDRAAVRPRGRVTERLRDKLAYAIAGSNRSVADVAAEYGVSWPTAHKALVAAAARWLPEPEPTAVLGIDETRFRSVRWILDGITWRRSDPWMTSFVDCTPGHPGRCSGSHPAAPAAVSGSGWASSPTRSGDGSRSW